MSGQHCLIYCSFAIVFKFSNIVAFLKIAMNILKYLQ